MFKISIFPIFFKPQIYSYHISKPNQFFKNQFYLCLNNYIGAFLFALTSFIIISYTMMPITKSDLSSNFRWCPFYCLNQWLWNWSVSPKHVLDCKSAPRKNSHCEAPCTEAILFFFEVRGWDCFSRLRRDRNDE